MKNYLRNINGLTVGIAAVTAALGILVLAPAALAATLNVNNGVACGGAGQPYCTIGAAIAAATPGSTIKVAAGTYPEQLTITKPLTLIGSGNKTIVAPATVTADATSSSSGNPLAPIILVQGTTNVSIENLEINGTASGAAITGCAPDFFGIVYQNASGVISDTTVDNVELSTSLFGCQSGNAIFVQTAPANTSNVTIENNTVANYDKNGITCDEAGSTCTITDNTVTGVGPTALIAQNGVQLGFGATGSITGNQISGDSYSAACNTENYFTSCTMSGGILLYDAPGSTVSKNKVSASDVGIWADEDDNSTTTYAISNNTLLKSYGDGMVFDGADGASSNNSFQNNPVGLLVTDYSDSAMVTSINDQFLGNTVNNEALEATPGSTLSANLIVETTGSSLHFPLPIPHLPHFPFKF